MCVGLSGNNGDNDHEENQLSMVEKHFESRDQVRRPSVWERKE